MLLFKKYFLSIIFISLLFLPETFAVTPEQFKQFFLRPNYPIKKLSAISLFFLKKSCANGTTKEALEVVNASLTHRLKSLRIASRSGQDQEMIVAQLCGLSQVLTSINKSGVELDGKIKFIKFLFPTHERTQMIGGALRPEDDTKEFFSILEELSKDESAEDSNKYFELKLAIALVWDQPRPQIHSQIGYRYTVKFAPDLIDRYTYFKTLYAKRKAKLSFRYLDYKDLIFVVDTPIPLTELEWAKEHVRGNVSNWGKVYSDIRYDTKRLNDGIYDWPGILQGDYSLKNIRKHGGICVDQAYFCTITARAFGVPALYFSGMGKRGGHAWCSYMKREDMWDFDVGRYKSDSYMTGYSIDPQTNKKLSDHDVSLIYNKAFRKSTYRKGQRYQFFANFLFKANETILAKSFAAYAVKSAPLNIKCWNILQQCLFKDNQQEAILKFFDNKIKTFKDFPDIVVNTQINKIDYLKEHGHDEAAIKLLSVTRKRVDKKRDDLERVLSLKVVKDLLKQGDNSKARKEMESTLKKHRAQHAKLFEYIEAYLALTMDTEQTKEAARFLAILLKPIFPKLFTHDRYKAVGYLSKAYINNNDKKKSEKLLKKYLK
jgi:hypothetical protein